MASRLESMTMKYSIIALGRLGQRYAEHVKDCLVVGSYNSQPKEFPNEVQFDFTKDTIPDSLQSSDVLLFNLTPSVISSLALFENFLKNIRTKHLIFISSTSVYGDQGEVNEDTPPKPTKDSGKLLLACEQALIKSNHRYTIIRPSGIVSEESHPGRFMSGRNVPVNGEASTNLIHILDLVGIIDSAVEGDYRVINATNIHTPKKKEYYCDFCQREGLKPPSFEISDPGLDKIIKTKFSELEVRSPLP